MTPQNPLQQEIASLPEDWGKAWSKLIRIRPELESRLQSLASFLESQKKNSTIYPRPEHRLRALREVPLSRVRVVLLGQDRHSAQP